MQILLFIIVFFLNFRRGWLIVSVLSMCPQKGPTRFLTEGCMSMTKSGLAYVCV